MYEKAPKKEEAGPTGTVCLCGWCGDRFASNSGKCAFYCKNCKTADQRKALKAENDHLRYENAQGVR